MRKGYNPSPQKQKGLDDSDHLRRGQAIIPVLDLNSGEPIEQSQAHPQEERKDPSHFFEEDFNMFEVDEDSPAAADHGPNFEGSEKMGITNQGTLITQNDNTDQDELLLTVNQIESTVPGRRYDSEVVSKSANKNKYQVLGTEVSSASRPNEIEMPNHKNTRSTFIPLKKNKKSGVPMSPPQSKSRLKKSNTDQHRQKEDVKRDSTTSLKVQRSSGPKSTRSSKTTVVKLKEKAKAMGISRFLKMKPSEQGDSVFSEFGEVDGYSSGQSCTRMKNGTCIFEVGLSELTDKHKRERLLFFWRQAFKKAKGASILTRGFFTYRSILKSMGSKHKKKQLPPRQAGVEVKFNESMNESQIDEMGNIMYSVDDIGLLDDRTLCCVIMPSNPYKTRWDMLIMGLMIYTATYFPFKTCFEDDSTPLQFWVDLFVDTCFLIDIILNFFTAVQDPASGRFIVNKSAIAIRYIKAWFFMDLFTSIPWQLLEELGRGEDSQGVKILRIVRIQRLYRLLRIFRLFKLLRLFKMRKLQTKSSDDFDDDASGGGRMKFFQFDGTMRNFLQISLTYLFFNHLMACFWFIQAKLQDFPKTCWVVRAGLLNSSSGFQYLVSFYWAYQTLTTVGFGDINAAENPVEQVMAIWWMVFGVGFSSYSIGNFIQIIQSLDRDNEELQTKIQSLNSFRKQQNISNNLYYRIKRHFQHNLMQKSYQESEKFMSELPFRLRDMVIKKTHGKIIKSIQFFSNKSTEFNSAIIYELQPINLGGGELLYQQNDTAEHIYFIHLGTFKLFIDLNEYIKDENAFLQLERKIGKTKTNHTEQAEHDKDGGPVNVALKPSLKAVIQYVEGSYFGDSDIFSAIAKQSEFAGRDTSAVAQQESTLFVMDKQNLQKIKNQFSDTYREMRDIAIKRFKIHQIRIAKYLAEFHESIILSDSDDLDSQFSANREESSSSDDGITSSQLKMENIDLDDYEYALDPAREKEFERMYEKARTIIVSYENGGQEDQLLPHQLDLPRRSQPRKGLELQQIGSPVSSLGNNTLITLRKVPDLVDSKSPLENEKQKVIEKAGDFQKQYDETLKKFCANVDYITIQSKQVGQLTNSIEKHTQQTVATVKGINADLAQTLKNLNKIEELRKKFDPASFKQATRPTAANGMREEARRILVKDRPRRGPPPRGPATLQGGVRVRAAGQSQVQQKVEVLAMPRGGAGGTLPSSRVNPAQVSAPGGLHRGRQPPVNMAKDVPSQIPPKAAPPAARRALGVAAGRLKKEAEKNDKGRKNPELYSVATGMRPTGPSKSLPPFRHPTNVKSNAPALPPSSVLKEEQPGNSRSPPRKAIDLWKIKETGLRPPPRPPLAQAAPIGQPKPKAALGGQPAFKAKIAPNRFNLLESPQSWNEEKKIDIIDTEFLPYQGNSRNIQINSTRDPTSARSSKLHQHQVLLHSKGGLQSQPSPAAQSLGRNFSNGRGSNASGSGSHKQSLGERVPPSTKRSSLQQVHGVSGRLSVFQQKLMK